MQSPTSIYFDMAHVVYHRDCMSATSIYFMSHHLNLNTSKLGRHKKKMTKQRFTLTILPMTADTIQCGDCLALLTKLPDRSVHFVFTSPPYALQCKEYDGWPEEEYPEN